MNMDPYMANTTVIMVAPTIDNLFPVKHRHRPIIAIIINTVCNILHFSIF